MPNFFDRSQGEISKELATVVYDHLFKINAISPKSDNELRSAHQALIEIVAPTVSLLFTAHEEAVQAAVRSSLRPLIDSAYLHISPSASKNPATGRPTADAALSRFIAGIAAQGYALAVRRTLVEVHGEQIGQASVTTSRMLGRSIVARLEDAMGPARVRLLLGHEGEKYFIADQRAPNRMRPISKEEYEKRLVDPEGTGRFIIAKSGSTTVNGLRTRYFMTKGVPGEGGTVLVAHPGEDSMEESEEDVDWSSLDDYTPTQSDLDAARKYIADGILIKRGAAGSSVTCTVNLVTDSYMDVTLDSGVAKEYDQHEISGMPVNLSDRFSFLTTSTDLLESVAAALEERLTPALSSDLFIQGVAPRS